MTAPVTALMTALLVCSFGGYFLLTRELLGLRREFVPGFVFSTVSCVLFFCGLTGVLYPGAAAVLGAGLAAFAVLLARRLRDKAPARLQGSLFGLAWGLGCLLFLSLLLRSHLTHYDNFSHWAIVVKQMLSTDAFPTAQSALIDFKNYPLGGSVFLYYICRFAGHSQPVMLLAQGLLIFSCFYGMFGIISEKKRFLLYAFLGMGSATLSFFNLTVRINNLLVDFLLPICTLYLFAAATQYRGDPRRALAACLPMAGLLTVTKSTGIVFAAFGLLFLLYMLLRHRGAVRRWRLVLLWLLVVALALTPTLGWSWHMKTSFAQVENKFDLQNITADPSGSKTPEQVEAITTLLWREMTNLRSRPVMGLAAFQLLAMAAVAADALFLHKKWRLWRALLALDLVVVLYMAGIWGLYVYSMPWDEASWLAGFERYASSIVVLFAGGLVLAATTDLERSFHYRMGEVPDEQAFRSVESKNNYQKGVLACLAVGITVLLSEYNGMAATIRDYPQTLAHQVQAVTGDRWVRGGEEDPRRYLMFATDRDAQVTNFHLQYLGRYFLFAPQVDGICVFYEDNLDHLLSQYDYLVMAESTTYARFLLKKHYGVSGEQGLYQIQSQNGQIALLPQGVQGA